MQNGLKKIAFGNILITINFVDGRLSITGEEGRDSFGQIVKSRPIPNCNLGEWTPARINTFYDIWERWHLNDMRAGTPAQEEIIRKYSKQDSDYVANCNLLRQHGLYVDRCYTYGTKWLTEEIPAEVLAYLQALPNA